MALFSRLGYDSRERFYADDKAGRGALVTENPEVGLALLHQLESIGYPSMF